jgi:hypothetical protein
MNFHFLTIFVLISFNSHEDDIERGTVKGTEHLHLHLRNEQMNMYFLKMCFLLVIFFYRHFQFKQYHHW